jgi:hypothetical protein
MNRKPQINDSCPNCIKNKLEKIGKLQYVGGNFPYTDEYLWCNNCNSTYSVNHKVLWQEDINSIACDMIDALEKRMKEVGMVLDDDKSDILFDNIIEIIDEFGTGDYRNHN